MISELVAIARRGAEKAAAGVGDPAEYSAVASFVGACLEEKQDDKILTVKDQLKDTSSAAQAWYLEIVRTQAGTRTADGQMCHLVFLPLRLSPDRREPLELPSEALETCASGLEETLDLGFGSLKFEPVVYSVKVIEHLRPSQCFSLVSGESVRAVLPGDVPVESLGVIIGRWYVQTGDKKRMLLKLNQAVNPRRMTAWRMRSETALSEVVSGHQVRVFWPMQLQHVYTGIRLLELALGLETAVKAHTNLKTLEWFWDKPTQLRWVLSGGKGSAVSWTGCFPEEPPELPAQRLQEMARKLGLTVSSAHRC